MGRKEQAVMKYLNKKYACFEEEFEIVGAEYAGFRGLSDVFYMRAKSLGNRRMDAKRVSGKYLDNYMHLRLLKEYEEWITPIYQEQFGPCKCICSDGVYALDRFTPSTTFEEFIHSPYNGIKETILLQDDKNNAIDFVVKCMRENQIPHGYFRIKVMTEPEDMKKITCMEELEKYEEERKDMYVSHILYKIKDYEVYEVIDKGTEE